LGLSVGIVVYNVDSKGGMERQASQLALRLSARGLRVVVISTVAPGALCETRPRELAPGIPIHRIPITRSPWFERIARAFLAREGGVDVLYGLHYRCGVHAVSIARGEVPVVWKLACSGEDGDFAVMARLEDHEAKRALVLAADRCVCISLALREEALAYGLEPSRLVSIQNGVDLAHFAGEEDPAALPELGAEPRSIVLFLGRLDPQKRVPVLLRAFALVVAKRPEARLAIGGTGALEGELRALTLELGLAGKVAFLGARSDVRALHRAARVFVLPSASEGLPNALLEALAAGTPSVATNIAGTNELARNDREALLVPVDDAPALAGAIVRLLEDEALAARLARAGKERAREYDLEAVAERYQALFSALARPHPPWRLGVFGALVISLRALGRLFLAPLRLACRRRDRRSGGGR
jgi:glycosyltransferase involved in cell wall biosynthesis